MKDEALNQVPDAVHDNSKRVTLYAGNLDFKENCSDKRFKHSIQVNELTIVNYHRSSKGVMVSSLWHGIERRRWI